MINNKFLTASMEHIRQKRSIWGEVALIFPDYSNEINYMINLSKNFEIDKKKEFFGKFSESFEVAIKMLQKIDYEKELKCTLMILVFILDSITCFDDSEFLKFLLYLSENKKINIYQDFLRHLNSTDEFNKTLSACLVTFVLINSHNNTFLASKIKESDVVTLFKELITSHVHEKGNHKIQSIGLQFVQELLICKKFRRIFYTCCMNNEYKVINAVIETLANSCNSQGFQFLYNILLIAWIISFDKNIKAFMIQNYPLLIENLLQIANESIKLKIVRVSVALLKNLVYTNSKKNENFKVTKLFLLNNALSIVNSLKERKFTSKKSDDELSCDLDYISQILKESLSCKLSSFEEYLTEIENPNLISWTSPTHKSDLFWSENSYKFKENSFNIIKKIFIILSSNMYDDTDIKIILLNDIQYLIKNLGKILIDFINNENNCEYKILIMSFLENNNGNNLLKYEGLKTLQLLVCHNL